MMIKIKLKQMLWDTDIPLSKVAQETGLHYGNLSNIKRGKHTKVNLETIDKLCTFFDCKLTDLLEFHK